MYKGFHKKCLPWTTAQMPNQCDSSAMNCKDLLVNVWGALNTTYDVMWGMYF